MKYQFSHIDRTDLQPYAGLPRVWSLHTRVEITGFAEDYFMGWTVKSPLRRTGRAVYHSQKAVNQRSGKLQRSEAYRANDYARIMGEATKWERAARRSTQRENRKAKRLARRLK